MTRRASFDDSVGLWAACIFFAVMLLALCVGWVISKVCDGCCLIGRGIGWVWRAGRCRP